jgi:hypothetical protein
VIEIHAAIENAASADNEQQTPIMLRPGFSNVSDRRVNTAREIIRRFLEYVPDGMTVLELRDAIDGGNP